MPPAKKSRPDWDAPPPRKVHANAKVKNLPEEQQETLWLLLHPTDDTPPYTLEQAMVYLQDEHGISCALSTFAEWHSWYALRQRVEKSMARADQAKREWLVENPDATPEDLERLGQMVFTSESIESGNVKTFVALMRERSRRQALELDRRRLALLEAAAAEAKAKLEALAASAKTKGGLTPETLAEIEAAAGLL